MSYLIIGDSCFDIKPEDKEKKEFQLIPLTLQVDDQEFVDDATFHQSRFLEAVKASPNCPKSACPSPDAFMKAYEEAEADMIFVITLSKQLSGTYNAAQLGRKLFFEEHPESQKKIAVLSSDSASVGESLIGFEIQKRLESGASFEETVEAAQKFLEGMHTYFVLESLETLRKNGRLTGLQAFFASVLNIKPVMGADHGTIIKLDQARGITKALQKLSEFVAREIKDPETKTLGISHCNCPERAEYVKKLILSKAAFQKVYITETAGVSTMYANDGGVIVSC